ncbi:porphobilinogen synthase [Tessaracoccus sp. OH4464_COT-324]|uniref:porphobilinogen synthase n=1 Tax=Tessaracoccus sp. OH4464_COT-324 TaxID=2491059 RepID=UPI000F641769|nr:porphobilinogen synthase [Tessaracoccus sp. OH4464_COT-324]RRD47198.1 porphobilinogen synthase [Tessaracoccus sp. OH4464_COT-324]
MPIPMRPRRLRRTPALRRLVREVELRPAQLVLPVFVAEREGPIDSMPGVRRHTVSGVARVAEQVAAAGLGGIMLFGVPDDDAKDELGSAAWAADGILQRGLRAVSDAVGGETVVFADTCLDEFTSHGHCGLLTDGVVDNDATLPAYVAMALAQAEAGADVVSPSGMMDGQVAAIRAGLDDAGCTHTAILAYAAKYASGFYGPFREAVASTLTGDRRTYQQDPANRREGLREAELDLAEGADIVLVKPAGYYLDVLSDVARLSRVPVAAYQVSGEYSMIEAAAERGWLDRRAAICESVTAIVRAGADIVLTYWGLELAQWLK